MHHIYINVNAHFLWYHIFEWLCRAWWRFPNEYSNSECDFSAFCGHYSLLMNLIMNEQDYRPIFLITNHAAAAADVIRATEQIWAVLKSQEQRSETQPNQLLKLATKLCIYQTEPLSLATFFKKCDFSFSANLRKTNSSGLSGQPAWHFHSFNYSHFWQYSRQPKRVPQLNE